jgi:hypothetical protein
MRPLGLCALAATAAAYPGMKLESGGGGGGGGGLPELATTEFPEPILGTWLPAAPPQSILGPLAYEFISAGLGAFSAQRDPATGDVWWTLLEGQVFRVRETQMQYCFGYTAGVGVREQSPFAVNSTSADSVSFCWREGLPGMQTHTKDCSGCDCAAIRISMTGEDRAELTFWQSPPVIHAHVELKRSGKPPTMAGIEKMMPNPYTICNITDECLPWQFCPSRHASASNTSAAAVAAAAEPTGCAYLAMMRARGLLQDDDAAAQKDEDGQKAKALAPAPPAPDPNTPCFQLNGDNLKINSILPKALRYPLPVSMYLPRGSRLLLSLD